MPKNKTKKNGAANRIRRTANPIVARQNRNNTTNNNNGTIEYNSNNINNNTDNNNTQTQAQILRSALRVPGQQYPRKTLRAKPINMTTVKPKRVNGETYLVHKRTGNIWAPSIQTGKTHPLNNGTSYNASRAFPVQIRNYNMSKAQYKAANKALNIKTREDYANRHAAEIRFIQEWMPKLIEKFQDYNSRGLLTEEEKNAIFNNVKVHIINMYTVHVKNNTGPTEELPENIRRAREFQDNVFGNLANYVRETLTHRYANEREIALRNLETLIYVYHVFVIEKLHDKDIAYLDNPPPELRAIMFPEGWYLDYKRRSIV